MPRIVYEFCLHARGDARDTREQAYQKVIDHLSTLAPPWGLKGIPAKPLARLGAGGGASYTKEVGPPIRRFGIGIGPHRVETGDHSRYDDEMTISPSINNPLMDYGYFVRTAVPVYIEALRPYLAEFTMVDESVAPSRWPLEAMELDDFRDGVRRIWPANFWDRELCRRAFSLTPEQVVRCLEGHVAETRLFMDGALVIYSYDRVPDDHVYAIDAELRPLLKPRLHLV